MELTPVKIMILVQNNSLQVIPGLGGRDLSPLKFKRVKTAKRKVKTKSEMERARKAGKLERKNKRKARLQRRADRREEEKQRRAESGEPQVTKTKSKRDPKSNHGTESVDATILKLLGKSHKFKKVVGKGKNGVVEKKKVQTQQETGEAKWRPGMRREAGEGWQEERKLRQQAEAKRTSKKEKTTDSTMPKTSDTKVFRGVEEKQGGKTDAQQVVPIVDGGSDHEADGGHCSSGDGAPEVEWPRCDQPPLEPMPPCMKFYQVRRKEVTVSSTQIHG